jgi:uncharacterized protein RhaS with RHS repeats
MNTMKRTLMLLLALFGVQSVWGFYDPSAGRWINRDPLEERGGLNLYVALQNSPVDRIDPDGREVTDMLSPNPLGELPSCPPEEPCEDMAKRADRENHRNSTATASSSYRHCVWACCVMRRSSVLGHGIILGYVLLVDSFDDTEWIEERTGEYGGKLVAKGKKSCEKGCLDLFPNDNSRYPKVGTPFEW